MNTPHEHCDGNTELEGEVLRFLNRDAVVRGSETRCDVEGAIVRLVAVVDSSQGDISAQRL